MRAALRAFAGPAAVFFRLVDVVRVVGFFAVAVDVFFFDTVFLVATFLVDAVPFAPAFLPDFFLLAVFLVAAFCVPVLFFDVFLPVAFPVVFFVAFRVAFFFDFLLEAAPVRATLFFLLDFFLLELAAAAFFLLEAVLRAADFFADADFLRLAAPVFFVERFALAEVRADVLRVVFFREGVFFFGISTDSAP